MQIDITPLRQSAVRHDRRRTSAINVTRLKHTMRKASRTLVHWKTVRHLRIPYKQKTYRHIVMIQINVTTLKVAYHNPTRE
jgi:hypothetical protein